MEHLASGAGQGLHRRKRARDEDDAQAGEGGTDKRQATTAVAERSVAELPQQHQQRRNKRHHEVAVDGAYLQQGAKGGAELGPHLATEESRRNKRAKNEPEADVKEEEEGDDDSEDTMELAFDADHDERALPGGGNEEYFGYQLELCGEAVKGRRKQVVIQKRWRPDKTFVVGREQCITTAGGLSRVGPNLERISREHFQIRCAERSTAAAKRERHAGCSPKPCFFLKDLSANGTHLNNELLGKGVERELRHRDSIVVLKSLKGNETLIGYKFTIIKSPEARRSPSGREEETPTQHDLLDSPSALYATEASAPVSTTHSSSPQSPDSSLSASPTSKTFRSMGKATHYHGDNRLSYSLKVNTNSNIGASVRSNREHMFITTPAAEQAAAPSNDIPVLQRQQDDSSGSAVTTSMQLTQQPPPSASNGWRVTLLWLLARLVSLLFTLGTIGVKLVSLYFLLLSIYNYFAG